MLKNKFLYLLIFSTTLLGQEINKETLSQLEEMIMSDPATQALIVSHNGEIVLESYGEEIQGKILLPPNQLQRHSMHLCLV